MQRSIHYQISPSLYNLLHAHISLPFNHHLLLPNLEMSDDHSVPRSRLLRPELHPPPQPRLLSNTRNHHERRFAVLLGYGKQRRGLSGFVLLGEGGGSFGDVVACSPTREVDERDGGSEELEGVDEAWGGDGEERGEGFEGRGEGPDADLTVPGT